MIGRIPKSRSIQNREKRFWVKNPRGIGRVCSTVDLITLLVLGKKNNLTFIPHYCRYPAMIFIRNQFVLEYCGEVIDSKEFEKRKRDYAKKKIKHYYFMTLTPNEVLPRRCSFT